MKRISVVIAIISILPFTGCSEPTYKSNDEVRADDAQPDEKSDVVFGDKFPEVVAVEVEPNDDGKWRFNVTLSSAYDSAQRYADGWRVLDDKGNELGVRVLGHDHANEQPFTRSETIQIPKTTKVVFVEGRDQLNGWSGQRFKVDLPSLENAN